MSFRPKPTNYFTPEELLSNGYVDLGAAGVGQKVLLYDSSGNELVIQSLGSTIVDGTKTVTTAGTAVQITASSVPIKGVWVSADFLVGFPITVGASSVVGNVSGLRGVVLMPGNPPIFLPISNLNLLWVDSQTNGGKLAYAYIT